MKKDYFVDRTNEQGGYRKAPKARSKRVGVLFGVLVLLTLSSCVLTSKGTTARLLCWTRR